MNKRLGFTAIFLSATGMGLVGTLGRLATPVDPATGLKYITGDFLAFGRMLTGAIGFLIIILIAKKWETLRSTRISFSVFAGGFCIGASLALYVSSTLMTSIANAVFLIYTGPLFCTILARIFRKEIITKLNMVFLVLVFIGMLLTVGLVGWTAGEGFTLGMDLGANPDFPNKLLGDIFGLGSGVFYGLALFFYGYRADMSSEVRGLWNFIFGCVGAFVVMVLRILFIDSTNPFAVMTSQNWAWAFVLFVACGLIAIGFLVVAGKNLLAVEMSTAAYWECVVALLLGALIWKESLSFAGGLGGLLIVIGGVGPVLIATLNNRKRRRGRESIPTNLSGTTESTSNADVV